MKVFHSFLFPSDVNGLDVNPAQDTPVATRKEDTYIHFSVDVEIQRHVEKLPKGTCTNIVFLHRAKPLRKCVASSR